MSDHSAGGKGRQPILQVVLISFVSVCFGIGLMLKEMGIWTRILLNSWWTAFTDPASRHDDWILVDLVGNLQSYLSLYVETSPVSALMTGLFIALSLLSISTLLVRRPPVDNELEGSP